MKRDLMRTAFAIAASTLMAGALHAQSAGDGYPAKPVRVIVGLAPGGATDIQARMVAQKLSDNIGRSFVVENRTGAGGTIAYAHVAASPPDGYTVLAVSSGYSITPAIYTKLSYDPIKDLVPVSLVAQAPFLLLVHPSVPVKSAKGLLALAKARPGILDFGSAGIGSSTHMALELFRISAGIKVTHVPYRGTGPALIDTMSGQVHALFGNVLSSLPHARSGKLRALAVTTARRSIVLPDLPTISESGVPGYETSTWHGWLGPAGTPVAIVNKLSTEIAKSVKARAVAERFATDAGEPVGSTPEEFAQLLVTEIARWRKVVKEAGIRTQ